MRRRHVALSEILERALPDDVRRRVYSIDLVRKRWTQAVGAQLARRSEPEHLNDGVLTVRVTDPAWGRMILKLQGRIVSALNRALGKHLVRRINFHTRSELRNVPEPVPEALVREEAEAPESVMRAAESIRDPELRALVTRGAARYLRARAERRRS